MFLELFRAVLQLLLVTRAACFIVCFEGLRRDFTSLENGLPKLSQAQQNYNLKGFSSPALPLLGRLFHGLTQRFGIMDDGLELGVCQDPQQVVQDEEELGRKHVTVLDLGGTEWDKQ